MTGFPIHRRARGSVIARREFLFSAIASSAALALVAKAEDAHAQTVPRPEVIERSQWGADLSPTGPMAVEDARFLIVHHTATTNSYAADEVAATLRGIYGFHTNDRGWPDVAYNFFVDAYGSIWEGRTGSLAGPVRGDATGGNQGFAQLCCFVGDHSTEAPTPEAVEAMTALLAWCADRYTIDPTPGATVTFTSLGSNRWPAGDQVTTATIAGHRDMSSTACPGDAAYQLVTDHLPAAVTAQVIASVPTTTTSHPPLTTRSAPVTASRQSRPGSGDESSSLPVVLGGVAALGAACALGGILALRRRGQR